MAYHRQQGVDTSIVRIFNTYGPRMRPHDGRAIPTFLRQALQDRPITVFGDGSQTRSFCYVSDLIDGIIRLAESGHHDAGQRRQPERVHAARAGRGRDRGHGLALADRARGAADRRSARAPARRHARARAARLGRRRSTCARGCGGRSRNPASRPSWGWGGDARRRAKNTATCENLARLGGRTSPVAKPPTPTDDPLSRLSEATLARTEALPPVDIRRKRPPLLSFVLRAATLRRFARVLIAAGARPRGPVRRDLHGADDQGGGAPGLVGVEPVLARDQEHDRVRLPGDGAAVRPLRALRRPGRAAGPAAHRLLAVPGDGRDADLRPGQRRALLELLHLLRLAGVRDRLRRDAALGLRAGHRRAAAAGRLSPAGDPGRHRQAHRGRGRRAARRGPRAGRDDRLHLAQAAARQRPALARDDGPAAADPRRATGRRR